ncbi:MAG: hypothetical protein ABSF62_07630 [Bryobacteraceae bacterium]
MGSVSNLSSSYLQSILSTVLQGTGMTTNTTGNSLSSAGVSSPAQRPDNGQLSPLAQLMSTLQQLQQTDPAKYRQLTQQISTNLQSAAQTAQADGNSAAANQLNQLAADFTDASQSGQLPNIQDLAQAAGGHHHHHAHAASADADGNSSTSSNSSSTSSSSSTSQPMDQILAAYQANGTQNDSLNPMAIIMNTLSNAGISGAHS